MKVHSTAAYAPAVPEDAGRRGQQAAEVPSTNHACQTQISHVVLLFFDDSRERLAVLLRLSAVVSDWTRAN